MADTSTRPESDSATATEAASLRRPSFPNGDGDTGAPPAWTVPAERLSGWMAA